MPLQLVALGTQGERPAVDALSAVRAAEHDSLMAPTTWTT
jgi:hypothetical protein